MKKNLQTKFSTRQYMVSKDFEIYYYKDFELSKVEQHTHNYFEIYFFLEGDVSMKIRENLHPLRYGDVVVIPPHVRHQAVIHSRGTPYRRFVFWIAREYMNELTERFPAYGYLTQLAQTEKQYIFHNDRISFNTIQAKVFRLIEEIHSARFGREEKLFLCVSDLLLHLNRTVYETKNEKNLWGQENLYESLTDYIEEHLDGDISLDILAREFYVSKYHIAHVFKDNMGISIHQYITKRRLEGCRDAIRNHIKITEAYLMYGFKDYSSFYRAFRKEFGMSPKEWQETAETLTDRD